MEIFAWITDQLTAFLSRAGIEKAGIKVAFESYGLEPLWALLRDTYFSPFVMLFAIPLLLVLGRISPAEKAPPLSDGYVVLDFLYPLLALPVQATVIVGGASLIKRGFETYIPFMNTGLVDRQPIVVQAVAAVLITDFMFYVAHWVKHKVPWLWYFHAIHHSQRYVSPFTTFRNHPCEDLTNLIIKTLPIAIVGGSRPTWFLFVLLDSMWGFYIHANIRTNLGPLKYVLVTPQNHRLHHTIEAEQIDRNFGERLTVWDWLFGTLYRDFDAYPKTGVKGCEWIEEKGAGPWALARAWCLQFIYPFWMIGRDLHRTGAWMVGRLGGAASATR